MKKSTKLLATDTGISIVADHSISIDDVKTNTSILEDSEYAECMADVKQVGFARRGSKNHVQPGVTAVNGYIAEIANIDKAIICGDCSGALITSIPEGIPVCAYSDDAMTVVLQCASKGLTCEALLRGSEYANWLACRQLEDLGCVNRSKSKYITFDCYNATAKERGEALRATYYELKQDADNGFEGVLKYCEQYDVFTDEEEKSRYILTLIAGVNLVLTYGSFSNSGSAYSPKHMETFMLQLSDFYRGYQCSRTSDTAEFVKEYLFGLEKPKGQRRFQRIFKTEYEIMRRGAKVYHADCKRLLEELQFDKKTLVVVNTPYEPFADELHSMSDVFTVEYKNDLLYSLMRSGAEFLMFCDTDHIHSFTWTQGGLGLYSLNPRRTEDVQDIIITNWPLPHGVFSTLPKEFQELTVKNFEKFSKFWGDDFSNIDNTGTTYTVLRKLPYLRSTRVKPSIPFGAPAGGPVSLN